MTYVQHQAALTEAFARVVKAEEQERQLAAELKAHELRLKPLITAAQKQLADAWGEVQCLMADTGEFEAVVKLDRFSSAKLHYTTPGVRCLVDAEAVPDAYAKVERKAVLNEIKRDFLELWKAGAALPNWLAFEKGEPVLTYKLVKNKGD